MMGSQRLPISSPSLQIIILMKEQITCDTSQLFMTVFSCAYNIGPPVCGGVGGAVDVFVGTRATP